ncbi:MAG: hypothetical protein NC517_10775 [Firmicutes bacterium]|nr:hypothetical protein [Bacillota bacterium]
MPNMSRNHKDNVFCLLYREKKNLLSLYNAMNDTSYRDEEELEVVTLEKAICMKIQNDAAFVVDSTLNLYEQQASVSMNMPLRDLYYVAEELKKLAPPDVLYHRKMVKIPAPRFVVFYNGVEEQPERIVCRLSDMYERKEEEPELELKVTIVNINPGHSEELKAKCESLRGYMVFVEKVRSKKDAGMTAEEAVRQAVDECISENILAEFFTEHREDIIEMGIFEFDQELHDKALREDGIEEGGIKHLISQVCRKMQKNKTLDRITEDLEEEKSVIEPIYNMAKKFAPDYDIEKILKELIKTYDN